MQYSKLIWRRALFTQLILVADFQTSTNARVQHTTVPLTQLAKIVKARFRVFATWVLVVMDLYAMVRIHNTGWSIRNLYITQFLSEVNECSSDELNNCHVNATCTNTYGAFSCQCDGGFNGDGANCIGSYLRWQPIDLSIADVILFLLVPINVIWRWNATFGCNLLDPNGAKVFAYIYQWIEWSSPSTSCLL